MWSSARYRCSINHINLNPSNMPLIKRVGIALLAFAGPAYSYPPLNEARDYLSHWHGFSSVKNLFVL